MSFKKPFRAPPITPGVVYLEKARRQRRKGNLGNIAIFGGIFTLVFAGGILATNRLAFAELVSPTNTVQVDLCGTERTTCVVDGDTFWLDGRKIRIADIDTPEVSDPKCVAEYDLGMRATYRLRDLLNAGEFALTMSGVRTRDRFGRELRLVVRNGQSIGDQLVSDGLAHRWTGGKETWC